MSKGAKGNTQGRVVGEQGSTPGPAAAANPTVKPETVAEASTGTQVLDGLQTGLDVAGLIPGVGEIADLANAGISALRGDWVGAGLSLASAIPFAGWGATAAKAGRKVAKASGEAGAKAAKEAAERAAKEAAEKAEKEAAEKAAKEKGGKVKPKPKPKCGQSGPYKDRKNHDNDGMNWDHVPSQKALLERALREIRGRPLSQGQIDSIIENAPAIAIPKGLHQKASESFGGRQHQSVDGVRRPMRDAQDLQRATQENTQAILDQIDAYDPGCKGAYRSATQELVKRTDAEWAAWLKQVMRDSK
jgi:hypothetical protein